MKLFSQWLAEYDVPMVSEPSFRDIAGYMMEIAERMKRELESRTPQKLPPINADAIWNLARHYYANGLNNRNFGANSDIVANSILKLITNPRLADEMADERRLEKMNKELEQRFGKIARDYI